MKPLMALSVKQPWVWAMFDLSPEERKDVENRSWSPPKYILKPGDRLAIHASGQLDTLPARLSCQRLAGLLVPKNVVRSAIIGTVVYRGFVRYEGGRPFPDKSVLHYAKSRWYMGDIGWCFSDHQKFPEPIPCKGSLNLWPVPGPMRDRIAGWGLEV